MGDFQITCWCSAYDFPHRLNSGCCSGDEWAEHVRFNDSSSCEYCNNKTECGCEVASGQEDIEYCERAIEITHSEEYTKYPDKGDTYG